MFLKWIALLFQAVLPATVVAIIGHLTTLPRSDWQWAEYSLAAIFIGLMGIIAAGVICRVPEWLRNLTVHSHTDYS